MIQTENNINSIGYIEKEKECERTGAEVPRAIPDRGSCHSSNGCCFIPQLIEERWKAEWKDCKSLFPNSDT